MNETRRTDPLTGPWTDVRNLLNPPPTTSGPKPLTRFEKTLLILVALLGVGVGGLGLASSFDTVSAAAARWGFATPQILPIGIDIAIPVFTAVNLLLIRTDMPLAWVRFVPWVLTGVTCWLNIAAGHSLSAKVAHGTMPLLWVVLSEVAAHVYATRIGAVTGRRMEKIRRSRWILAPFRTAALWRRMVLWETTSYSAALALERDRLLARAALRERYGSIGEAPERVRVLWRLGALSPADLDAQPETGTAPEFSAERIDPAPVPEPRQQAVPIEAVPRPELQAAPDPVPVQRTRRTATKRTARNPVPPPRQATGTASFEEHVSTARALLAADPNLTGTAIGRHLGTGDSYGRRVRRAALDTPLSDTAAPGREYRPDGIGQGGGGYA